MTVQTRDYLKKRFERDDQPTEQDFQDLIDTMNVVGEDFVCHDDDVVCHDDAPVSLT